MEHLITSAGLLGIVLVVFAESGLLIGFFLPGDSLLFTAGFLASQGYFNIYLLLVLSFAAAVLGDNVGYAFGKRMGKRIFTKEDSLFFHKDHLMRAEKFYEKNGGKTIIMARFIPFVRTFAPIVAGVGNMNYRMFITYNLIGGLLWAVGVTLAGYFLGRLIPNLDAYITYIVLGIVLLSLFYSALHFLREGDNKQKVVQAWKNFWEGRKEKKNKKKAK